MSKRSCNVRSVHSIHSIHSIYSIQYTTLLHNPVHNLITRPYDTTFNARPHYSTCNSRHNYTIFFPVTMRPQVNGPIQWARGNVAPKHSVTARPGARVAAAAVFTSGLPALVLA